MAVKIVQNVNRLVAAGTATTSNPIALKSGYIRVSTASTGAYVAIGTDPSVSTSSFHVPPYSAEVIKERFARQRISGITTGATTVISFGENYGNVFVLDDYVTIEGAHPTGINTTHKRITSINDSSITIDFDSTSIAGVAVTNASVFRSVKVAAISEGSSAPVNLCEVVQLVTE